MLKIADEKVQVYQDSDLSAPLIAELVAGNKVELIRAIKKEDTLWAEIKLSNGQQGYMLGATKVYNIDKNIGEVRQVFAFFGIVSTIMMVSVVVSVQGFSTFSGGIVCAMLFLLGFSSIWWIAFWGLGKRKKYGLALAEMLSFFLLFTIIFSGLYSKVTSAEFKDEFEKPSECPYCGKEIKHDSLSCQYCGRAVLKVDSPQDGTNLQGQQAPNQSTTKIETQLSQNAGCSWPLRFAASFVMGAALAQIPARILTMPTGIDKSIVAVVVFTISSVLTWILVGKVKFRNAPASSNKTQMPPLPVKSSRQLVDNDGIVKRSNGGVTPTRSNEYKCPKCGVALKNVGDLDLNKMIEMWATLSPEMLKDVEVQCWKCGNHTTAADLISAP